MNGWSCIHTSFPVKETVDSFLASCIPWPRTPSATMPVALCPLTRISTVPRVQRIAPALIEPAAIVPFISISRRWVHRGATNLDLAGTTTAVAAALLACGERPKRVSKYEVAAQCFCGRECTDKPSPHTFGCNATINSNNNRGTTKIM